MYIIWNILAIVIIDALLFLMMAGGTEPGPSPTARGSRATRRRITSAVRRKRAGRL